MVQLTVEVAGCGEALTYGGELVGPGRGGTLARPPTPLGNVLSHHGELRPHTHE